MLTPEELKALESIPDTEEKVAKFMAECDAGLHKIPEVDQKALDASFEKLLAKLRQENPYKDQQYFAA